MKHDTYSTAYTLIPEPFPQWNREPDSEESFCEEVEKMKRDTGNACAGKPESAARNAGHAEAGNNKLTIILQI